MAAFRSALNKVIEWKRLAGTVSNLATTNTGILSDLCVIAQGQQIDERIGNELNMSSVRIRGHLYGNAAASIPAFVRIVAFQWVPIIAPAVSDILRITAALETEAFWNRDTADMYKIRWNRTFKLSANTASGNFAIAFDKKIVIPYPDRTVKYNVGSTNGTGKMYLLYITNAVTNTPTISFESVTNYSDP